MKGAHRTAGPDPELDALLRAGLSALRLPLPPRAQRCLLGFLALLTRWNRTFNLTGHRDPRAMIPYHILDSLALVPYLEGRRALDLGTGAGLPGIPLAVALPAMHFTLLDSRAKKIRFVQQAVIELGLDNVSVVCARAESFRPSAPFDVVLSRALASLDTLIGYAIPLCRGGGQLLAMKGPQTHSETDALPPGIAYQVHSLVIPGLDIPRNLIRLWIRPLKSREGKDAQ